MKIDRLLGITIFLLNREKVSARMLADKFEVSVRTIQRDIEALNLAGIPVVSTYGADGGYEILDSFKMERQVANDSDYSNIITALKGLSTACNNPKVSNTLEKMQSLTGKNSYPSGIILDFSVLSEGENIQERLTLIGKAITEKNAISFEYINSAGAVSEREAEPVALVYKWYSWYLLAFCKLNKEYRLFKLIRMNNVIQTEKTFSCEHGNAALLLGKQQGIDNRKYVDIKLLCKADIKMMAVEYLKGWVEESYDNGDFVMVLRLPENEHIWFGTLLALGDKAVVLEPDSLKQRLLDKAKEILALYE